MPTQTVAQTAPTDVTATNASLDAYNVAIGQLNAAQAKLDQMQASARPPDDSNGHDTGGKQWDKDYADASAAVADAKNQAAQSARQYASILAQQAAQAAKDTSPEGQAKAAQAQAQAEYIQAKADGYSAKTAADQQAAATRAQAALTRANATATKADTITTANGIYSKDDTANPGPDGSPGWRLVKDASGNPLPGTRDPAQQALTTAQANLTQANADLANATAPADRQAAQIKVDAAQQALDQARALAPGAVASQSASTAETTARTALTQAQADLANATLPAERQAAQLKVDQAQQALDAARAQAPATLASTEATTAGTQAATAQTEQTTAQRNAPTVVGAPTATDKYITIRDPNTGALTNQPNLNTTDIGAQAQQISQAAHAFRDDLQTKVLNGTIQPDEAQQKFVDYWNTTVEPQRQSLIAAQQKDQQAQEIAARSSQNQTDQTESGTANDLLTAQNNQATLGSNLLQKRADLANTTAQNVIGIGSGSKNFGLGAGGAPDISGLYGAATQNATDQLGGQSTMDAATRLVQQIDPSNKTGFAAHAAAALSQVLDRQQLQKSLPQPAGVDINGMLNQSTYGGAFATAPPPAAAPSSSALTTIAPDGTVTINHVPAYAQSGLAEGSMRGSGPTPITPVSAPIPVYAPA